MPKRKIVIIGSTPPPIGGVSIHIDRLVSKLSSRDDYIVEVVDPADITTRIRGLGSINFFWQLFKKGAHLYHHHKPERSGMTLVILLVLSYFKRKIIITIHNEDLADKIEGKIVSVWYKKFLVFACNAFDHVICVNSRMAEVLISQGVKRVGVSVIPAFIPAEPSEARPLPDNLVSFIKEHHPVLVGYVSKIYLYNGHDRYGGDMMLELISRLKRSYPNVAMIIVIPIPDETTEKKIEDYEEYIRDNSINENVFICKDAINLTSLFRISDIYVRPSNTDGDPIAVRESLYINLPTVASDCTYKPVGTVLHKDRDIEDLENKVAYVIENLDDEREKLRRVSKQCFGNDVIAIYGKYLGGQ